MARSIKICYCFAIGFYERRRRADVISLFLSVYLIYSKRGERNFYPIRGAVFAVLFDT